MSYGKHHVTVQQIPGEAALILIQFKNPYMGKETIMGDSHSHAIIIPVPVIILKEWELGVMLGIFHFF